MQTHDITIAEETQALEIIREIKKSRPKSWSDSISFVEGHVLTQIDGSPHSWERLSWYKGFASGWQGKY